MTKERRPSINDEERYEAMRQDGVGKEKAARIANTAPQEMERPAASGAYEAWTKEELYEKAETLVSKAGRR